MPRSEDPCTDGHTLRVPLVLSLQLGSIGWPSSLLNQKISGPLPEGPSTREPSSPAGEPHERAT
eukprot:5898161-Pleurochrysis_carterae.AAC.1